MNKSLSRFAGVRHDAALADALTSVDVELVPGPAWIFRACLPRTTQSKFDLLMAIAGDCPSREALTEMREHGDMLKSALEQENCERGIEVVDWRYLSDVQTLIQLCDKALPPDVRNRISALPALCFSCRPIIHLRRTSVDDTVQRSVLVGLRKFRLIKQTFSLRVPDDSAELRDDAAMLGPRDACQVGANEQGGRCYHAAESRGGESVSLSA